MNLTRTGTANVRVRTVALPTEHGGWGFISEPVLLGLLLEPGWAAVALAVAAFAAFLLRQPLKLYLKDVRAGRRVPRTAVARQFALIYGGVLLAAILLMLLLAPGYEMFVPLLLALPLLTVQSLADMRNRSRALSAELAGSAAPGAIASAMVLMGDWRFLPALALWLALAVKALTAVLYVRARLRLERGEPVRVQPVLVAHVGALLLLGLVAAGGALTWLVVPGMAVLWVRAAVGLSSLRKARPAKIIGMQEMAYGFAFVLLLMFGAV